MSKPIVERCGDCRYWAAKWHPGFQLPEGEMDKGYCRFSPPGHYEEEDKVDMGRGRFGLKMVWVPFPPMLRNGWCGSFQRLFDRFPGDKPIPSGDGREHGQADILVDPEPSNG